MACRFRIFLLKGWMFVLASLTTISAWGATDQIINPQVDRREIVIPRIDTEDFEPGIFMGIMSVEDFGTQAVYGARLAYHVTPGLFVEGTYGHTEVGETSYEKLSGGARLLTDSERKLGYYDVSLGYNLLPGETYLGEGLGFTSDFYVVAGVGSTDFAGNQRFTVNLGTGYRLLANDWLAVHLDMRDHLFNMDLLGENKTTHNIEISGGLSIFF
ncbi:MAG: outer membrane beta-barrel domain-containing protein [Gammaproteobacteria bacterium]|nr:outer membrane beta-barrel domain-containing protein [Gammaproteobacteria bacterium]